MGSSVVFLIWETTMHLRVGHDIDMSKIRKVFSVFLMIWGKYSYKVSLRNLILERLYKRMQRRLLQSIVSLSYDQLEDFVGRFRPPSPPNLQFYIYSRGHWSFTYKITNMVVSFCTCNFVWLNWNTRFSNFCLGYIRKLFFKTFVSVYLGVPNAPRSQIIEITLLLLQLKNFFLLTNRRYSHSCNGQHLHLNIERKDVPLPKSGGVSPCTKVVFP